MTIIVETIGSESSRDYDWLKASVALWTHRSDLTAVIPDFVMLAEKRLNGDLEARLQDAVVSITATSGLATVAIPADVADIRSLSVQDYGALDYVTPEQFADKWAYGDSGAPREYTVIGTAIHLGPTPDDAYTLSCAYRAFVPPLADSAGTNWLIETAPQCYLAATMCEALSFTKNFTELPAWEKKYADAVISVNRPDWDAASGMQVRTDSTTP